MGAQVPRIHISPVEKPDRATCYAFDMLEDYGFVFDDWQKLAITEWITCDERGKFVAKLCGLSIPRQNGKTRALLGRALIGILLFDEVVLWTAHEVKTARNAFVEMAALFDDEGPFPDLADQVDYIRRANGQEEIKLKDYIDEHGVKHDGGRVIFSARSRGAARGFTVDCLILDEAQDLNAEQYAALMPTISSGRNQNSQVIMCGTPPDRIGRGEIFFNTRKAALGDNPGATSWIEWSVDEIPDDYLNWAYVESTNPAFGARLMEDAISAEQISMPVDTYCRERLGLWTKDYQAEQESIISEALWAKCITDNPPETEGSKLVFAVKFSPGGDSYAISAGVKKDGAIPHVELIDYASTAGGIGGLVNWLNDRADKAAWIVVDGKSYSAELIFALTDRAVGGKYGKFSVHELQAGEMIMASSMFLNAVIGEAVTHIEQPTLDESVTHVTKRTIGSKERGGWGYETTNEQYDVTSMESAVIAHWAVVTCKKQAKRKQTVRF